MVFQGAILHFQVSFWECKSLLSPSRLAPPTCLEMIGTTPIINLFAAQLAQPELAQLAGLSRSDGHFGPGF